MNRKVKILFISIIALIAVLISVVTLLLLINNNKNTDIANETSKINQIANDLGYISNKESNNGIMTGNYSVSSLTSEKSYSLYELIIKDGETYVLAKRNNEYKLEEIQSGIYLVNEKNIEFKSRNDVMGIDGIYNYKMKSSTGNYIYNEAWEFSQFTMELDPQ